jgi:hypothetical protein
MTTEQINDVLNTRNESSTEIIHDLSINSVVLVFREKNTSHERVMKEIIQIACHSKRISNNRII